MDETEQARRAAELQLLQRLLERLEKQPSVSPAVLTAIRAEVSAGITEGISNALTPENTQRFWDAAVKSMQDAATRRAGTFLLSGVSAGARKLLWALILFLVLWGTFGWAGITAAWKALVATRSPQ